MVWISPLGGGKLGVGWRGVKNHEQDMTGALPAIFRAGPGPFFLIFPNIFPIFRDGGCFYGGEALLPSTGNPKNVVLNFITYMGVSADDGGQRLLFNDVAQGIG